MSTALITDVSAIAVDYAGTLTTSARRRPDGALVRRVLNRAGIPAGREFAGLYDTSRERYYAESLPDSLASLIADSAARTGITLPEIGPLCQEIWRECGDHPVCEEAADAMRRLRPAK